MKEEKNSPLSNIVSHSGKFHEEHYQHRIINGKISRYVFQGFLFFIFSGLGRERGKEREKLIVVEYTSLKFKVTSEGKRITDDPLFNLWI